MWKPSAISPYMLPRPMPEMMAEASMMNPYSEQGGAGEVPRPLHPVGSVGQRQDLIALEIGEDVIRRTQGILVLGRKRLVVILDQAVIFADSVKGFADGRAVRRARLGDRHRRQMHGVVGIG